MSNLNSGSFTNLNEAIENDEKICNDENQKELVEQHKQQKNKYVKPHKFRVKLAGSMSDRNHVSIWSILKQCVDKELYRFTIPIVWNEPVSLLQRTAENNRYVSSVLDKAADLKNHVDRMKYVAGFLITSTSIHIARMSKPFNPLLGETFELTNLKESYRVCCEQVSHHPPISAYYSESLRPTASSTPKWKYYGSVYPHIKLNILNASVEAFPIGISTLELPEHDETYTWNSLKVSAHNLVLGKLWFEYTGRAEIINHKLKLKCYLEFKPYSWFTRQIYRVEGYIVDANDNKVALLYGKWDNCFYATNDVKNPAQFFRNVERIINNEASGDSFADMELIWKIDSSELNAECFNFSDFTMQLNELYDDLERESYASIRNFDKDTNLELTNEISIGPIAPTDSRYRPDMRFYEEGKIDEASAEKHRLEEKQRETRRKTESGELAEFQPMWFEKKKHPVLKEEDTWCFNNKYWNRDFSACPNIF